MKVDLVQIEKLYSEGIEKHGIDSRSVGWNDTESQVLRFEKLSEVIDNKDTPITVNELGCGYGCMFNFLVEHSFKVEKFVGYDISPKMLDAASNFITDERAIFVQSDKITEHADYSFTSGIFNVNFDIDGELWRNYIEYILHNMNEYSRKGFAFNLMTTYVDYRKDALHYADPLYYFDFCKKHFSRKVSLLHDYELFEWTMIVKL